VSQTRGRTLVGAGRERGSECSERKRKRGEEMRRDERRRENRRGEEERREKRRE
jgi:hypothetical protein